MSIISDISKKAAEYFSKPEPVAETKENVSTYIDPIFIDIPPDLRAGKYIHEGLRGWAFCAISAIADEVSAADLMLYQKKGKEWTEVYEDSALYLLSKPNSFQTREEFFWLTVVYLLAEGEVFWVLDKPNNPTAMAILDPVKVTPVFDKDKIIGKYKYQQGNGKVKEIPAEEIIFIKLPNLGNPFRGAGVMSYIRQSLDLDNYMEEYLRRFFFNSALPSGVLEAPGKLSDKQFKRVKSQFEASHKGIKNAHKFALLEGGLKFNMTAFNMNQLQMTEMNVTVRDRVLAAFKVPKSVLGIIDEVNRANSEAADRAFAKRAVRPKLKMLEAQLNQFFLPKFKGGDKLWFEFENLVKEDEYLTAQTRELNIRSGVRSADEYRADDGLEPLEKDEAIINEEAVKRAKRINRRNVKMPKQANARTAAIKNVVKGLVKEMVIEVEKKKTAERKVMNAESFHNEKITNSDRIEANYKKSLRGELIRQKKEVLAQLDGKTAKKKAQIELEFDEEQAADVMARLSVPHLEQAIAKQGLLTYSMLGLDGMLSTNDDRVRAYLKTNTVKLGKETSATTAKKVSAILADWGAKEGSMAELKASLTEFFDDPKRAETIARTEVSRANGYATETVYKDNGVVGKRWVTAPDERVCQFCGEMDGKTIGTSDNFFDKGDSLTGTQGGTLKFDYESIGAYPLHVNCRCDLLPIFGNEV